MFEIISKNTTQTKKLARLLAQSIDTKARKEAFVIALEGELGGGKTTFIQGLAKGLNIKEKILSPTFVLMKRFGSFYHIDCYRIKKPKELLDLGFQEIIKNPKNIIAIEWAEKIKKILPKDALWLKFKHIDEKTRKIQLLCPKLSL